MIENLRAKPVKKKELKSNVFELIKNTPKQINKDNNLHIAYLHEEKPNECVDEHLYIHSRFDNESFAIVGHEFKLNFFDDEKTADLSYYYFGSNNLVSIYLYDLKKKFSGIDVLYKLVLQWKSSIEDADYCIKKLQGYSLERIKLGVIIEDNDIKHRNENLKELFKKVEIYENAPSYYQSKQKRNLREYIIMAKQLKGFDEGKVTIDGVTYEFDVREFVNKKHHMYFENGQLKPEDKAV